MNKRIAAFAIACMLVMSACIDVDNPIDDEVVSAMPEMISNISTTQDLSQVEYDIKKETVMRFTPDYLHESQQDKLKDIIVIDARWVEDENGAAPIIDAYLQYRGFLQKDPYSVIRVGDIYTIEYYTDNDRRISCFIVCLDTGLDKEGYYFCVTYSWDDLQNIGEIEYKNNHSGDALYENLFNTEGVQVANISYAYFQGIPFSFISKHETADEISYDVLNRNQKFWLYENAVVFNEEEKAIGFNSDIYNKHDERPIPEEFFLAFIYDEKDRLKFIHEEFLGEHGEAGLEFDVLSLEYHENGFLKSVEYNFYPSFYFELPQNHRNRGTWDCSGIINYDEQGRMIYRDYYITHGRHYCVYLYKEESKRPWAYIEFCSNSYSGENNYGYGNDTTLYLFQDK